MMRRAFSTIGASFVGLLLASSAFCDSTLPKRLVVGWEHERLSVHADSVPLALLIKEIAKRTGLRVRGAESQNQKADVNLQNLSLEEGLSLLLRGVNFAILEEQTPEGQTVTTLLLISDSASRSANGTEIRNRTTSMEQRDAEHRLEETYEAAESGNVRVLEQVASLTGFDATKAVALDLLSQKDPESAAEIALRAASVPDVGQRVMGLQALAHIDSAASIRALGDALNDSDAGVRQTALVGLSQQTGPEAASFISRAATDPDPTIRAVAKELLGAAQPQEQSVASESEPDSD